MSTTSTSAEKAVRDYLVSLREPSSLRDENLIARLQKQLDESDDELERLHLRQQIIEADTPNMDAYEEAFTTHAKAWAEKTGVSDKAFLAEGVPAAVLRKAGFRGVGSGRSRRADTRGNGASRKRVSADEVRQSIPKGTFTVKDVQQSSGASSAVVRRVINEEVDAGNVTEAGPDPDHAGPGRAPTLYKR